MNKCNCMRNPWSGMDHAYDCPARLDSPFEGLQFQDDGSLIPNAKSEDTLELRGNIDTGHDPRNYYGRLVPASTYACDLIYRERHRD